MRPTIVRQHASYPTSSMVQYQLSPHVRYCRIDGAVIALDIRTQKYLALPANCGQALQLVVDNQVPGTDHVSAPHDVAVQAGISELLRVGLLVTSSQLAARSHCRPVCLETRESLLGSAADGMLHPRIRLRDVVNFTRALLVARCLLKFCRFEQIIKRVEIGKAGKEETPEVEITGVRRLFDLFRWQRLWFYTANRACLLDSLTLICFLRRYGVEATLVLGVRSRPFAAHAWVQWNEWVLNDTLEKVKRYTPILSA